MCACKIKYCMKDQLLYNHSLQLYYLYKYVMSWLLPKMKIKIKPGWWRLYGNRHSSINEFNSSTEFTFPTHFNSNLNTPLCIPLKRCIWWHFYKWNRTSVPTYRQTKHYTLYFAHVYMDILKRTETHKGHALAVNSKDELLHASQFCSSTLIQWHMELILKKYKTNNTQT